MRQSPLDIAIAGEINLDLILYGLPEKMALERELLASDFRMTLGSSSAILAHNLAVLGARVGFATKVGADDFGRVALDRLHESGADLSRTLCDPVTPTGVTILLHHGIERHILTYSGTISQLTVSDLDMAYLMSSRHFHLSSLFLQQGLAPDLPDLFRKLKKSGVTLSLDTNDDPADEWGGVLEELLDLVDILLPNEAELCHIAHRKTTEEALATLSARVPCIAVKCGPRGSRVRMGSTDIAVSPVSVNPVDTIGAGDSFNAGFLFAWLQGMGPEDCAMAGNIAGALSTQRAGGTEAFRDKELVRGFLSAHQFPARVAEKRAQADEDSGIG